MPKKDKFPLADLIEVLNPEPVMVFIAKSTIHTRPLFAPLRANQRHVYEYDNMHGTLLDQEQRKWIKNRSGYRMPQRHMRSFARPACFHRKCGHTSLAR